MFALGVLYAVTIALGAFAIGGSITEYRRIAKVLDK